MRITSPIICRTFINVFGYKRKKKVNIDFKKKKKCLPMQMVPSPVNPFLQAQLKLPNVFVQIAWESHPPFVEHSSTSNFQILERNTIKTFNIKKKNSTSTIASISSIKL